MKLYEIAKNKKLIKDLEDKISDASRLKGETGNIIATVGYYGDTVELYERSLDINDVKRLRDWLNVLLGETT